MISEAQAETAKVRAQVATLTQENARLTELINQAVADRDRENALKEEFEEKFRRTVSELSAVRKATWESAFQGLGVAERFLTASQTIQRICGVLRSESEFVGVHCYTFDLSEVMDALIAARLRGATVRVLADEQKTHCSKATGQAFARGMSRGVQVRIAHGFPLEEVYVNARPGRLENQCGGSHAKVLFARQAGVALIGSTNLTQGSMANAELTAQISTNPTGMQQLSDWFQERWSQGVDFDFEHGSGRFPSRARSQGAPRSARYSRSAGPAWDIHAPSSAPAPPCPAGQ